ncbi:hypothetical protein QAB96_03870, partial [Staphylococcus aureus]
IFFNHHSLSKFGNDGYFLLFKLIIATTTPMKVTINIPKLNIKCNAFAIDITIGFYFQKC